VVFDGIDDPSKKGTKNSRDREKINSNEKLLKRIFNPNENDKNGSKYIYSGKYCPSPIEFKLFIQYLNSKKNQKLEIKFSLFEADSYIAKLAKEENG